MVTKKFNSRTKKQPKKKRKKAEPKKNNKLFCLKTTKAVTILWLPIVKSFC